MGRQTLEKVGVDRRCVLAVDDVMISMVGRED